MTDILSLFFTSSHIINKSPLLLSYIVYLSFLIGYSVFLRIDLSTVILDWNSLKDGDFILGRALLWTDTNNKKWIDRVYTYKDTYNNLFSNWAKNNGYDDAYRTEDKIMIKLIEDDTKIGII